VQFPPATPHTTDCEQPGALRSGAPIRWAGRARSPRDQEHRERTRRDGGDRQDVRAGPSVSALRPTSRVREPLLRDAETEIDVLCG